MIIRAKIKTNQSKFSIAKGDVWKICCKSRAENNKANMEILKELSKIYGSAKILRGAKSKRKLIEISEK